MSENYTQMRNLMKTRPHIFAVFLIPILLLVSACDMLDPELIREDTDTETDTTPKIVDEPELTVALEEGQRAPLEVLVQATKPSLTRSTRTLDEAREAITSDQKMEPLREALEAGGWDEEQQAQMVYFAGTHQSGAPEDSIRHRQQQIHDELSGLLSQFRDDLAAAEKDQNVRIDRDALYKAGVVTRIHQEVIQ